MLFRPFLSYSIIGLLLLGFCPQAHALFELGFDFGYNRQIYGSNRQNNLVNRSYQGSLAMYIFSTTAIELNVSQSEQITTENNVVTVPGTTVNLISTQNRVQSNVYGVGIKQGLLPMKYAFRPMISLGYARQFTKDTTDFTYELSNKEQVFIQDGPDKRRYDSVFGSFILQWQIGRFFSLKGSVGTIFPAFDFDKAKDNIKYMAGFSTFF